MVTATGTAFLGLTVDCARCHDHKFDPITPAGLLRPPGDLRRGRARRARRPRARRRAAPAEAPAVEAELAEIERRARRLRAARPARRRRRPPRPPVEPAPQRRAVRAVAGPVRPVHRPGDERRHRALHRRAGGLHRRTTAPRNVAAGRGRGARPSASSVYPGQPDPQDRAPQRRPIRQRPELDLARAGQGLGRDRAGPSPRRSTASSGAATARGSYRDRLADRLLRSRSPPSRRLAGRRLVAPTALDRSAEPSPPRPPGERPSGRAARAVATSSRERLAAARRRRSSVYAGTFSQPGPDASPAPRRPDAAGRRGRARRPSRPCGPPLVLAARRPRGASAGWPWPAGSPTRRIRCPPG